MKKIASTAFDANLILQGSWGATQLGKHASTMDLYMDESGCRGCIEWDIPGLETTEQIGLWFEYSVTYNANELIDYDGVSCLPIEAVHFLRQQGFRVTEDML